LRNEDYKRRGRSLAGKGCLVVLCDVRGSKASSRARAATWSEAADRSARPTRSGSTAAGEGARPNILLAGLRCLRQRKSAKNRFNFVDQHSLGIGFGQKVGVCFGDFRLELRIVVAGCHKNHDLR
jgi:hypothetical protein